MPGNCKLSFPSVLAGLLIAIRIVLAHNMPKNPKSDWTMRHMAEEHHISSFDPDVFFKMHDFDSSGHLTRDEIRRIYGLLDPSTRHVSEARKTEVESKVLEMYDTDHDLRISREEFIAAFNAGVKLPDFGLGPGHHGDDEYEYEIHHFEKFHAEDSKDEDLVHPEDIEHFRKHEEQKKDASQSETALLDGHILLENIPSMFRTLGK